MQISGCTQPLRIRFPWRPVSDSLPGKDAPAGCAESWARDRAPLWQRDMPGDWWLIGTGECLRILCSPQDRGGGGEVTK